MRYGISIGGKKTTQKGRRTFRRSMHFHLLGQRSTLDKVPSLPQHTPTFSKVVPTIR